MNIAPECKPVEDEGEIPDHYVEKGEITEGVSEYRQRQIKVALRSPEDITFDGMPSDEEIETEIVEGLQRLDEIIYGELDTIEEALIPKNIAASDLDSFIDSKFPVRAMVKAYIIKMVSPNISGFDQLEWFLDRNSEIAEGYGFDPEDIPDRTTISTQWYERYLPAFRQFVRFKAAYFAAEMTNHDYELDEKAYELIDNFLGVDDNEPEIPEARRIENESRDRVFNEFTDLFNNVIDYDRAQNWSVEPRELTNLATYTARRNEPPKGGRDVYVKENDDVDGEDYMSEETLPTPVRSKSRREARQRQMQSEPIPAGDDEKDWMLDPADDDYGEGSSWHKQTEKGIEKQVSMLQERGMLDRPVDVCIDGVARCYNYRSDTEVDVPDGVHNRYNKFDTGYAFEDVTLTAIYRGRAIVLANFSHIPENDIFRVVKYLLDRATDLLSVRNVYADSEFANTNICSYITHLGLDYVMANRQTEKTKRKLDEEIKGAADHTDYELISGDSDRTHDTTLVAVEKRRTQVKSEGDEEEAGDGVKQATLTDDDPDFEGSKENILSYSDIADWNFEYATFITSLDVDSVGIDPAENPVGHDPTGTVWGAAELYRKRWSIETAFRDFKQNFKAKPRSRCIGVRRFFFMICLLLYNCWVLLNLIVAHESEDRDPDEIIYRKKTFVVDIQNEVFPDIEFG